MNANAQGKMSLIAEKSDADLLNTLFAKSDRILVKKLSNNDRDWARYKNKHQDGVYIPHEIRDGGFFPKLFTKKRNEPEAAEIREAFFTTLWAQADGRDGKKQSRLVHYTSKGQETHMTRLPKLVFAELMPASFLVMGRVRLHNEIVYECLTIDSTSDEASLLFELFDLDPDFLIKDFVPAELRKQETEKILNFAGQVVEAWLSGDIDLFARESATMPDTAQLALLARESYLRKYDLNDLNPFNIDCPGDALRDISRTIEWELFRNFQRKERSVELVRILLGNKPIKLDGPDIIRRLIDEYSSIDALMLSASQQRKSRAGYSYEHHIEAMLIDGGIPFQKQVVIQAKKRPDFVLPSLKFIDSGESGSETGLILSAKTTLRERWKQVEREKGDRKLYLTTVDENIAGNAIEDMASFGVHLVIPESLQKSKETEYKGHKNVLSFRSFCEQVIAPNLPAWPTIE